MKLRCLSDLNEKSTSNHKTFAFKSNVEKKNSHNFRKTQPTKKEN